ncbi:MAG: dihydropteroate synthase, partial [Thermodesulfobacteriota bacterium]
MIMEDATHARGGLFSSDRASLASSDQALVKLSGNGREFVFGRGRRTLVMGILNVTPDSFSDGDRFLSKESAVARALEMVEHGADLIDVGGESTRPGAVYVEEDEELERVIPVVQELAKKGVVLSIDTSKAAVAREALKAGAWMINDVSALRDPRMADVLNEFNAPVVLMHMRGTPQTMQSDVEYDDLTAEILAYLSERLAFAVSEGVEAERIVIDPGIGFGKSAQGNFLILKKLKEFKALGRPVLIGASRKSFLSQAKEEGGEERGTKDGPLSRLAPSLAAESVAILN